MHFESKANFYKDDILATIVILVLFFVLFPSVTDATVMDVTDVTLRVEPQSHVCTLITLYHVNGYTPLLIGY